jgi:hypothetical protein
MYVAVIYRGDPASRSLVAVQREPFEDERDAKLYASSATRSKRPSSGGTLYVPPCARVLHDQKGKETVVAEYSSRMRNRFLRSLLRKPSDRSIL